MVASCAQPCRTGRVWWAHMCEAIQTKAGQRQVCEQRITGKFCSWQKKFYTQGILLFQEQRILTVLIYKLVQVTIKAKDNHRTSILTYSQFSVISSAFLNPLRIITDISILSDFIFRFRPFISALTSISEWLKINDSVMWDLRNGVRRKDSFIFPGNSENKSRQMIKALVQCL